MAGNGEQTRRVALQQLADSALRGKAYWRSLGDYADTPEFKRWAQDEFPQMAEELEKRPDGASRRSFLQIMGASLALAGLGVSGCRRPEEKIRPYTTKPINAVMGKGLYFATSFVLAGRVTGVLAETHEGRPTKMEGNPNHPNSRGATDLFAQASILDLYDPDRSRNFLHNGKVASREEFLEFASSLSKQLRGAKGEGLAVLSEDYASPVITKLLSSNEPSNWCVYEPLCPQGPQRASYDLSKAEVILCLDCDLLGTEDEGCRHRLDFSAGRQVDRHGKMNRLYVVEPAPTNTGASADHRLRLPASDIKLLATQLHDAICGRPQSGLFETPERVNVPPTGPHASWMNAVIEDLRQAGRSAMVSVGSRQPAAVHQMAAEVNHALHSDCVRYYSAPGNSSCLDLVRKMEDGSIETLVVLGGNPAYNARNAPRLREAMKKVRTIVRLGLYEDETSELATWHVPAAHYLESWDLAQLPDGTLSPMQPAILPLFGGMQPAELLARLLGRPSDPYELAREAFKDASGNDEGTAFTDQDEKAWQHFLQQGVASARSRGIVDGWPPRSAVMEVEDQAVNGGGSIELAFSPDPSTYDGRFANNGWLQECPDPVTKLTWDNAALLSPTTAKSLEVRTGDVISIDLAPNSVEAPVFVLPGCADNSITLPLGYGRRKGGKLCDGAGVDAYSLWQGGERFAVGAKVSKTGKTYKLATTQEHWAMDLDKHFVAVADEQARERAIIREGSADQYKQNPAFAKKMGEHAPIHLNIYASPKLDGANQWGMTIDLNACVGCNACVVACQAENNIPIVGKDEVINGREMHWMRLDRYFTGDDENSAGVAVQPMLCQHCEAAPCEPVCPVNATVHSPEGLNEMAYNRCIGTRYCSNNCPYKVRRFNFFDWNKGTIREDTQATRDGQTQPDPSKGFSRIQIMQPPMQETLKMQKNPNVTVRIRGVMEKCTYCVQRIEMAKIETRSKVGQGAANAEVDGKPAVKVPDGMIQTACQQVCPTKAIVFGDVSDPKSEVAKSRQSPRSYEVLEHLNVKPRTLYLAKIRNLNPALKS
jgi:molybdopterin-containing oxidoreductase family iron-sulfur binding subunit